MSTLLLTLTVFLLLTAYYLLKTAREPLILLHGGAEVKSYAAAGQSVLLLGVVRGYGVIAARMTRMKLLATVYFLFAGSFGLFAAAAAADLNVAVPFYLWVGVFSVTAIAQFWAFAADVYDPEQGKRLFAVVGAGSSIGAVAGARIAKALVGLGPSGLIAAAAVVLVGCLGLLVLVERRFVTARGGAGREDTAKDTPLANERAFHLLMRDRYLLLIAALILVLNWVNSNGEYILDRSLLSSIAGLPAPEQTRFVGAFKAEYFGWVNFAGVVLQLFAVSRILTRLGIRTALLLLPGVALVGYGIVVFAPVLSLIRAAKIAENGIDYSVQSTSNQALYLAASRTEKYVGKTTVDTLFVRLGDVLSAVVVWAFGRLALPIVAFAALNILLVLAWIGIVLLTGKENARRAAEPPELLALEPHPA